MVSSPRFDRDSGTKSGVLILAFSVLLLSSCTANKSPTDTARLFTADELMRRAVVLAPVAAEASLPEGFSSNDFNTYDQVFLNVMATQWERKGISLVNKTKSLEAAARENWRQAIAADRFSFDSPLVQEIDGAFGRDPLQIHALILTNQVSCGRRDPLPSYIGQGTPPMSYCQRLMKLQFQIFDRVKKEKVWSGLIYSSNESSEKIEAGKAVKRFPAAPPVEGLVRDAFKNFAQIMAGSLPNKK